MKLFGWIDTLPPARGAGARRRRWPSLHSSGALMDLYITRRGWIHLEKYRAALCRPPCVTTARGLQQNPCPLSPRQMGRDGSGLGIGSYCVSLLLRSQLSWAQAGGEVDR